MMKAVQQKGNLISILVLVLLVLGLIVFTQSKLFLSQPSQFSMAVTIDFLLTIPLLYFLFIRKTKVPKTTVVPVFVLGMLLASILIPKDQQYLLQLAKQWVLPIVELAVLAFVGYKVYRLIGVFKDSREESTDVFTQLKMVSITQFGAMIGFFLATEISVFYYGFLVWKKKNLAKNNYSYHKKSGTMTLLIAFIGIIFIETLVLHAILVKSNPLIAWILTGLSLYTMLQIFGILKSVPQRPIFLDKNTLYLRYGIMAESQVPITAIRSIERSSKEFDKDKNIRFLSPLGVLEGHSIILHMDDEQTLDGLYGMKKKYQAIAIHVDEAEDFEKTLNQLLED